MLSVSLTAVTQVLRDQGILRSPEDEVNFIGAVNAVMIQEGATSIKMPFGKHVGKTLYAIMLEDPKYIHGYLLNTDYIKEKFTDLYAEATRLAATKLE